MKPQRAKKFRRAGVAAVLAAVLAFGVSSSSWAYWSASATLPAVPLVAAVPTPSNFTCTSIPGGLLNIPPPYVRLNWEAASPATGWTYQVVLRTDTQEAVLTTTSARSYDVKGNLLSGVTGTLAIVVNALLTGSSQVYVEVRAIQTSSGWVSDPTVGHQIALSGGLLGGLLGGLRCAP
ncbi:hypothetical protein [Microbacterium sp. A94]|uniref:hypothetical protein n=1 Tax=Microbacterium sp. A94 TaxID=3450717 RepID=UPI003F6DEF5D